MWSLYRRPLAAQAYYLLGDYQGTLELLEDFEPQSLNTGGFDSRWGMLGRVRLLRAARTRSSAGERRRGKQYREVLASGARLIQSLQVFVQQAEQGLARVGEAG